MPSRQNLVPTPVTDKNGKATTVYRKAGVASGSAAGIPMPQVATTLSPDDAKRNAEKALTEIGFLDYGTLRKTSMEENITMLSEDSPEALAKLVNHIVNAGGKERSHWSLSLKTGRLYFRDAYDVKEEDMGEYAHDAILRKMAMHPIAAEVAVSNGRTSEEGHAVELVREAFRLTWLNPGESYSHAKAMVVCLSVKPGWEEMDAPLEELSPEELDELLFVSRNIDAVVNVLPTIAERKSIDSAFIASAINEHPALAKGVL